MPAKKNQHYVPKFYLKLFAGNEKSLFVYNIRRKQSYPGNIAHLCSKNYFYSKDVVIEDLFDRMESQQAVIMRKLVENESLKMLTEEDYWSLYSFVAFQHARTMKTKILADQMLQHLSDEIQSSALGDSTNVKLIHPQIHLKMIAYALQGIPLFYDLGMVLLVNNTARNFISSDHPVVFTNSYFSKTKSWGVLGIQSPGLQICVPISRRLALLLYDVSYYSTNTRGSDASTIPINSIEDVEALNGLQFVSCTENIFYSSQHQEVFVAALYEKMQSLIGRNVAERKRITGFDNLGNGKEFVHFYTSHAPYDIQLSFVVTNDDVDTTKLLRNPVLVEAYQRKWHNTWQASRMFRK